VKFAEGGVKTSKNHVNAKPVKILLYFRTHLNAPENMGVVQKCKHLADAFRAHGAGADTIFFGDNGLVFNEINQVKSPLSTKKGSLGHLF
jgi:hypothetical protein